MVCLFSGARARAFLYALGFALGLFSQPLQAQDADYVQSQIQQIQASLKQIKSDYEQRINTLEQQVSQLKQENKQLAQHPLATSVSTSKTSAPQTPAQQRVAKTAAVEASIVDKAPPPAAAAPEGFPNLGSASRGISLDAELILDAKYAAQSQNPSNPAIGWLPSGAEGVPRGLSIGETELAFKGSVDNLFRAEARFVFEQTGNNTGIRTEEVFAETLGLPWGTKVKAGKYWSNVGYLNDKHPHEWDFVDLPLAYNAFFGGQLNETGAQLSWVAPTDETLIKLGGEIAQGSNVYPGSFNGNYNQNKPRLGTVFAKAGGDVGTSHSWQGGVSYIRSTTGSNAANQATYDLTNNNALLFNGGNTTWLADFVYRWAPEGDATSQNLKWQTEVFLNNQGGAMTCSNADGNCGNGTNYNNNQQGLYSQAIYQFMPKWRAGYRYDRIYSGNSAYGLPTSALTGSQIQSGWSPYRNSLMMDWANSEFSLIRLQLARDNVFGSGVYNNQIYLQYIMTLGAHGSHKY